LCRFNLSAPRHAQSQRLFCIVCRPVRGQDRSREQSGRHFRGRARALSRFQSVTWTRPVGRSGDGAGPGLGSGRTPCWCRSRIGKAPALPTRGARGSSSRRAALP